MRGKLGRDERPALSVSSMSQQRASAFDWTLAMRGFSVCSMRFTMTEGGRSGDADALGKL